MARTRKTTTMKPANNTNTEANKPEEKKVKGRFKAGLKNFVKSPKTRKALRITKAIAETVVLAGAGAELIYGRKKKYGVVPMNHEPDLLTDTAAEVEPQIHTETVNVDGDNIEVGTF